MAAKVTYWEGVKTPYQMEKRRSRDQVIDEMTQLQIRSVLDVGCGTGAFYNLTYGMRYKGVDYCKNFIKSAQELAPSGDFEIQDARKLKEKDNSYDAVLFYHALEHVGDWKQALKEAKRVCKKYVFIVLWRNFVGKTVTNRSHFYADSNYYDTWLHEFSREELEKEMEKLFKIEQAEKIKSEGYNFIYLLKKENE